MTTVAEPPPKVTSFICCMPLNGSALAYVEQEVTARLPLGEKTGATRLAANWVPKGALASEPSGLA